MYRSEYPQLPEAKKPAILINAMHELSVIPDGCPKSANVLKEQVVDWIINNVRTIEDSSEPVFVSTTDNLPTTEDFRRDLRAEPFCNNFSLEYKLNYSEKLFERGILVLGNVGWILDENGRIKPECVPRLAENFKEYELKYIAEKLGQNKPQTGVINHVLIAKDVWEQELHLSGLVMAMRGTPLNRTPGKAMSHCYVRPSGIDPKSLELMNKIILGNNLRSWLARIFRGK